MVLFLIRDTVNKLFCKTPHPYDSMTSSSLSKVSCGEATMKLSRMANLIEQASKRRTPGRLCIFFLLRLLHANPEAAIIFTTDVQRSNISKVFMLSLSRASAWIMQLNTL